MSAKGSTRPIFVVGYQRSGTTLLQALLGSHPQIAAPPETYFLFRIARLATYYGDLSDDSNLRRALHDSINPPTDLLVECGFDEDTLFERLRAGPRTMRSILDTIMGDFAARHGKSRWSEKTPGQTAGEVLATFPDAQIVHIVRDPRDVVASSLRTPWSPPDAYAIALAWKEFFAITVRAGLKAGPANFLQVRYEDLTRDPATVLGQVFAFLGESFDASMHVDAEARKPTIATTAAPWQLRVLEDIAPAVEGGWKKNLVLRDRRLVSAVLFGEIAALGYEPVTGRAHLWGRALAVPKVAANMYRDHQLKKRLRDPQGLYEATQAFLHRDTSA